MARRNARTYRRATIADVTRLEARRLLAIIPAWVGQSATKDYVGTEAGDGPDGVRDDELTVSNINATETVQNFVITDSSFSSGGQPVGAWETGSNDGYAPASSGYTPGQTTATIYLNPYIYYKDLSGLSAINLGVETKLSIAIGDQLKVTALYSDGSSDSELTQPVSSTSAPNSEATAGSAVAASPPQYTLNGLTVSGWSQNNTTNFGWVHVNLAGLDASTIASAVLSDPAGGTWFSGGAGTLVYAPAANHSTDLSFPPTRDEDGSTMSLLINYKNGATPSVIEFTGGLTDPGLTAPTGNNVIDPLLPSGDTTGVADLAHLNNALNNTQDGIIQLGAASNGTVGQYYLNGPVTISRPVTIEAAPGASITVSFRNDSQSTAQLWTDAIEIASDQVKLSGFKINFLSSIPWNLAVGYPRAVIGDATFLQNGSRSSFYQSTYLKNYFVGITLENLGITGPPAPSTGESVNEQNLGEVEFYRPGSGAPTQLDPSLNAVTLLNVADGRIDNNTIVGGTVDFNKGPWNIDNNDVQGAVAGTYSNAAFTDFDSFINATDITIEGNHAHQVNASGGVGRLYRLFTISGQSNSESYNLNINDNIIDGGVGFLPGDVTSSYDSNTGIYTATGDYPNAPEVILLENYGYNFEGKPLYVSGSSSNPVSNPMNGRILVIPPPQGNGYIHAGSVVSILSGRDNGHMNDAGAGGNSTGEWFLVDQVLASTSTGVVLLMNRPMPLDPNPQYGYDIEVDPGQVNPTFDDNTINLSDTFSHGLVLNGNDYDTRIVGNHFIGGDQMERSGGSDVAEGLAFIVSSSSTNLSGDPETYIPSFGTIIDNNVIQNSLGGGDLSLSHTPQLSTADKTFITATVTRNVWEWNDNFVTAGTPFRDSPPAPHNLDPVQFYQYPSALNNDVDDNRLPVHKAIGTVFTNSPDFPLLKTLTIGDFNAHINNDDNLDKQTQYWALDSSHTVGQTANSSGYYEGMNGFVDPIEEIVSMEGNSYQILNPGTKLPEPNYVFPANSEIPTTVIVAGIINTSPYVGTVDDDTTKFAPQQGSSSTLSFAAIMIGQDGSDEVGSALLTIQGYDHPSPPDGIQDEHVFLENLDPNRTISTIYIKPYGGGGGAFYSLNPTSDNQDGPEGILVRNPGSTIADFYFEAQRADVGYNIPDHTNLQNHYDIIVNYSSGTGVAASDPGIFNDPSLAYVRPPKAPSVADDFDGDGKADLVTYGLIPGTSLYGFTIVTSSSGFTQKIRWDNLGYGFGNAESIPVIGDYFGDGRPAYAIWIPQPDGTMLFQAISSVDPTKAISIDFGVSTDVPVVADVDGDGKDDFGAFGNYTGVGYRYDFLLSSRTSTAYPFGFDFNQRLIFNNYGYGYGVPGSTPVVGDFDGSGHAGLGVYLPVGSAYVFVDNDLVIPDTPGFIINPPSTYYLNRTFGLSTDIPLAVDHDGDGKSDLAVYGLDPATGLYRYDILTSSSGFNPADAVYYDNVPYGYGYSASFPVMADYEGTGHDDFAEFQPDGMGGASYVFYDVALGTNVFYDLFLPTDLPANAPSYVLAKRVRGH